MAPLVPVANLDLARRLERAEGMACAAFAESRRRLFPKSAAEWIRCAGTFVVFDGIDSPITQTFGLGIYEEASAAALEQIETFFHDRGALTFHEVCPFAGTGVLDMLCARGYRPIELSNVLYRTVEKIEPQGDVQVRVITPEEVPLWSEINAAGWSHEHPEFRDFLLQVGTISAARSDSHAFLAEIGGRPGAAGMLLIHEGIALFGGAATIPEMRRRGLQTALFRERMHFAHEHGCDVAMMAALPGSDSQRNAERAGFRIAYTRTKWRLDVT